MSQTIKLFNKGERTIKHTLGELKPGELVELPQAEALYLKKLFRHELLDTEMATAPLQGEAKQPELPEEQDERKKPNAVKKAEAKEEAEKAESKAKADENEEKEGDKEEGEKPEKSPKNKKK